MSIVSGVLAFTSDYYAENPAPAFHSTTLQESAPVQTAAAVFPNNLSFRLEEVPSIATYKVAFAGKPGYKASHEGMDFVHNKPAVAHVPVIAAARGTVAYVRTGCPQSAMFGKNASLREAGAGWGNHVVLYHGNGIYTRYAHLAPGSIRAKVGDKMVAGDVIGEMGNSGRSETRHLHFELGYKASYFVASKPSQSFDLVLNPEKFFLELSSRGRLHRP
jgi:murein DD-endopeptidase MepM/ murein hydrolase activator NlpD